MIEHVTDNASLLEWGSGKPALVFLHYFSGAAVSWQWVAEKLESEYRCISIDLPGFGDTPPLEWPSLKGYGDFVWQTLLDMDVRSFVLVGHSMGGKIALQVAASPEVKGVQRVILVAPSPPTQEPMPAEEKWRLLNYHPSQANAEMTIDNATQKPLSESQRAIAAETHMEADDSAWNWWLLEGMENSIADKVRALETPVTVLASKDDPVIPFDKIQQDVISLLPNAELVEMSGIGHLIPLEDADAVAQTIRRAVQ